MRPTSRRAILAGALACGVGLAMWTRPLEGQGRAGAPGGVGSAVTGTGIIVGRVIEAESRSPVPGALVRLSGAALGAAGSMRGAATGAGGPRLIEADNSGRFLFTELPKGTYNIDVTLAGYIGGRYGQDRPQSPIGRTLDLARSLDLTDGETKADVTIQMWRQGAITGTVLDENNEPLVGIQVRVDAVSDIWIGRLSQPFDSAITDDRGVYRMDVIPGDYVVSVGSAVTTMPARLLDDYRQKATSMETSRAAIDTLNASGVISPFMSGLHVGELVVGTSNSGRGGQAPPIWTKPEGGPLFMYPLTYYPAASLADAAAVVTVQTGEERAGIDFALKPQATFRVSGHVLGPAGPVSTVGVRLVGADWNKTSSPAVRGEAAASATDESGAFTFYGVLPGQYTLDVLKVPVVTREMSTISVTTGGGGAMMGMIGAPVGQPSIDPTWWAAEPIVVGNGDVADVTLQLAPGGRISGRLEFIPSGQAPPPDRIRAISIAPRALPGTAGARLTVPTQAGASDETGAFRTAQLVPGLYVLSANALPPGWVLRSAMTNGRDMADVPIDVDASGLSDVVLTFTNQPTALTGSVAIEATPAGVGAVLPTTPTVVIFPTDQSLWPRYAFSPRRLRTTAVSSTLNYRTTGLPPGEYFVAATPSPVDFTDPKILAFLARIAPRVTLVEGESRVQDVHAVLIPAVK